MKLFTCGRLCLMGEHSDWVSSYKVDNERIKNGKAIISGLELGILAEVQKGSRLRISMPKGFENLDIEFNAKSLYDYIQKKGFFSYVCGCAIVMFNHFNIGGLNIKIENITLPIKKGLASSAAICLLIIKSYNDLYDLKLGDDQIMEFAYLGEREIGANCGMMDEISLLGSKVHIVDFANGKMTYKSCTVKEDLYLVFADLKGQKDTKKILSDLNSCFPYPKSLTDKNVHYYFRNINNKLVDESLKYIESGDAKRLGKVFTKAQKMFDKYVAPKSTELKSPLLHKWLNDSYIKSLTYGCKGVGSQGDGSIQFIAKDKICQEKLVDYLLEKGLLAYKHTIKRQGSEIKSAFIPAAGNGTRLYPYTKICKKEFFPVIHKNMLKPQISVLLEELYNCGIKNIYITISNHKQYLAYKNYFKKNVTYLNDIKNEKVVEYELKLKKIWNCLHFIYNNRISMGFAYSINLFANYVKGDSLLCLGDTLYMGNKVPCIKQLLDAYKTNNQNMVGICEIPLDEVTNYGVCKTEAQKRGKTVKIMKFVEKPDKDFAIKNLCSGGKFYGFAGCYIISPKIFDVLKCEIVKNNKKSDFTKCLDDFRNDYGYWGLKLDGHSFDFGNVNAIKRNFNSFVNGVKNNEQKDD